MSNIFTIYYNLQNIIITLKKLDVLFDKIENLNSYCNNKEELKNTLVISQLLYTKYKTIDWFIDLYKNIIFISYKKTKLVDIYNYIKNPELLTIKESKNLYLIRDRSLLSSLSSFILIKFNFFLLFGDI